VKGKLLNYDPEKGYFKLRPAFMKEAVGSLPTE